MISYDNPCAAVESDRFADILRQLLDSLDGEIVTAALIRQSETDLLDTERQEVDRVREFLDGRISMVSEPGHLRSRGLAVLDSFARDLESAADHHESSPCSVCGASSVGEPPAVGDASSDPAAGEGVSA